MNLAAAPAVAITVGDRRTPVRCWTTATVRHAGALGTLAAPGIGSGTTRCPVGGPGRPGAADGTALSGRWARNTCAVPDDGPVRCWGTGGNGRPGYADTTTIGDNEAPTVGPVDLGAAARRWPCPAAAHTCAVLDDANGPLLGRRGQRAAQLRRHQRHRRRRDTAR